MRNYAAHLKHTPQTEAADPTQVENSAGGFVFQLRPEQALVRWLILGAEGTYYASERKLTVENARTIQACLDASPAVTVETIAKISEEGRAPKNDPAVFALALAAAHSSPLTRALALAALPRVCRTATHLFQFVEAVQGFRGWGRGLKNAVAAWYLTKSPEKIAYQVAKYRNRGGWSHRDVLRLTHPKATDPALNEVLAYAVTGLISDGSSEYLQGVEALKTASEKETIRLVLKHGYTHEMVSNDHKNSKAVWEALLQNMPLTAMIRNLGKMSSVELLVPLSNAARLVTERLSDQENIRQDLVHPISILSALTTYSSGHGVKGSLTWRTTPSVIQALDSAFYLAFGNVKPSGKKTLIALDVSGSMALGEVVGVPGLTPRMASAAMALVTMRTEPEYHVVGFSSRLIPLDIHDKMDLMTVVRKISGIPFGATDCAQPMLYAKGHKLPVEAFQIWTDNETYVGHVHPHQALRDYRSRSGKGDASLAVIGTTATNFSIADPSDPRQLDVVGFDTATPNLLAEFASGW